MCTLISIRTIINLTLHPQHHQIQPLSFYLAYTLGKFKGKGFKNKSSTIGFIWTNNTK